MPRITLPDETRPDGETVQHWADLKDPTEIRQRDRKKIMLLMDGDGGTISKLLSVDEGVMALLVTAWSYPYPLPSQDINQLGELTIPAYNALSDACKDAVKLLFPNLGDEKDPQSPSKPSTV
jgi:hypothetical protein